MENSYRFFNNRQCQFFPCHPTEHPETFNCLFCYCPLYALGDRCGGNPRYLAGECKDCSNCMLPHRPENYDYIISKYDELMELAKQNRKDPK